MQAVIAVLLAFAAAAAHAQSDRARVIRIGLIDSLTGSFAAIGQPPAAAMKLAAREINDRGGIVVGGTTHRFDVTEVDNQSQTLANTAAMSRLVEEAGIKFIFGPTVSNFAVQAASATVPAKVMHFSAATSWQARGYLSDPGRPLLFGLQVPPSRMTQIDASALKALGATKVAYLSQDDDVTRANAPSFLAALKSQGIAASLMAFPSGTTDFSPFLMRARVEGFDAVYHAWPPNLSLETLRTAVLMGVGKMGIGGRAIDPKGVLEGSLGNAVPMPFFSSTSTPWLEYPADDKVAAFAKRIKAFSPYLPSPFINGVFYTYDAFHMLADAMKQAGTVDDTAKIAEALGNLTYDGVAGRVCFGKDMRTAMYDSGLVIVKDGKVNSDVIPGTCR